MALQGIGPDGEIAFNRKFDLDCDTLEYGLLRLIMAVAQLNLPTPAIPITGFYEIFNVCPNVSSVAFIASYMLNVPFVVATYNLPTPRDWVSGISAIIYTWKGMFPLAIKLAKIDHCAWVRHHVKQTSVIQNMLEQRPKETYACTLCDRLSLFYHLFLLEYKQYENGRRCFIVDGTFQKHDICIKVCPLCMHYKCHDIFFDLLGDMVSQRRKYVRRANFIRSFMMERYFRQRFGRDIASHIMPFIAWTPRVGFRIRTGQSFLHITWRGREKVPGCNAIQNRMLI